LAALHRAEDMGAEVVQLFAQSNRQWHLPDRPEDTYSSYQRGVTTSGVVSDTVCHAPYLVNVISPDLKTERRSRAALVANLRAATSLGALGLVLHPGSHRGTRPDTAVERIGHRVLEALDEAEAATGTVCRLLLENTAGAGDTVGRTFAELAGIIAAAGGDPRIGVCLDTQHLWASGISFATPEEASAVVGSLAGTVGLDRLGCLHLNDSKVPFGANRDRHENLGEGYIGADALAALLGEPRLQDTPAVLEVPGSRGKGPGRADLEMARSIHARGHAAHRSGGDRRSIGGEPRPSRQP
jgi:deoxyribonuclease-4